MQVRAGGIAGGADQADALALLLDCGLWTEDRDFFGCGLSVWQTAVLYGVSA